MTAIRWFMAVPARVAILAIRGYKLFISPLFPPSCRFTPSCSSYALTSVERFGLIRGGWLAVRRVGRCHPWSAGGHDPVPERQLTRRLPE